MLDFLFFYAVLKTPALILKKAWDDLLTMAITSSVQHIPAVMNEECAVINALNWYNCFLDSKQPFW
jgi:hypothetical protein